MVTRAQKVRLGVFITVAMAVMIIVIATLSFDRIFDTRDIYYIAYEDISVSGLEIGSQVKYLGLNVGNVRRIEIDPVNINRIIVTIAVDRGTPIKEDVRGEIIMVGITGLKQIELRGGTDESEVLPPGGFIIAGKSITEDITGRAEIITEKIELVLNNLLELTSPVNQERMFAFFDESSEAVKKINEMVDENRERFSHTMINLDTLMTEIKYTSRAAGNMAVALERFLESDTLNAVLADIRDITSTVREVDLSALMRDLNRVLISLNGLLDHTENLVMRNSGKLIETIDELHLTTRYLSSTARRIDANPSILIRGSRPDNPPDDRLEK